MSQHSIINNRDNIIGIGMKKITTILALILAQNSYALQIEGVNGVEILAVNGEKIKTSFFSDTMQNELKAGTHQIVVKYSKDFDDEKKSATSDPVIFNIDLTQDTQISVPNYNQLYKAERAIDKGLIFQAINEDSQYNIENAVTLTGTGFLPFADIEAVIATYNQKNNIHIASATMPAATTVGTSSDAIDMAVSCTGQDQIALYQQSSPAQKKAFRLWLLEQDLK